MNTVFIGHGGDRQWEVVRDYLVTGGVNVEAFESGERASLLTLDVVGQMIRSSRFAILVLTGADATADGRLLARQNVVHELGFAHGALGIENTIVLLEQGTEEFTNIAGLTQIRFSRGEIHTTKERVLSLIAQRSEIGWGGGC
jgi:predicted nucleotide-binding protein